MKMMKSWRLGSAAGVGAEWSWLCSAWSNDVLSGVCGGVGRAAWGLEGSSASLITRIVWSAMYLIMS